MGFGGGWRGSKKSESGITCAVCRGYFLNIVVLGKVFDMVLLVFINLSL